jgi:catalase (peroxidase I)
MTMLAQRTFPNSKRQDAAMTTEKPAGKCPFNAAAGIGTTNRDWWPNQLRVDPEAGPDRIDDRFPGLVAG